MTKSDSTETEEEESQFPELNFTLYALKEGSPTINPAPSFLEKLEETRNDLGVDCKFTKVDHKTALRIDGTMPAATSFSEIYKMVDQYFAQYYQIPIGEVKFTTYAHQE